MPSAGQADLIARAGQRLGHLGVSEIDERVAERVRRDPDVAAVSGLLFGTAIAPGRAILPRLWPRPIRGVHRPLRVREGRMIQRPREMMLGRLAADSLQKKVGDRLQLLRVSATRSWASTRPAWPTRTSAARCRSGDAQDCFGKARKVSFLGDHGCTIRPGRRIGRRDSRPQHPRPDGEPSGQGDRAHAGLRLHLRHARRADRADDDGRRYRDDERDADERVRAHAGDRRAAGARLAPTAGASALVLAESLASSLLAAASGLCIGVGLSSLFMLEPTMGSS